MGSWISALNCTKSSSVSNSIKLANNQNRPTIKLLLLGLDAAGKTTTVMHLLGNPIDDVVPTVGFSSVDMKQFNKFKVQIYDLGGGPKIRGIWKNYFALVHGIIFVIDSADSGRLAEVEKCLVDVVSNDKVSRKPLLILINKQDLDDALHDVELLKQLNLEDLINRYQCPTKIESCSASANYDISNPKKPVRDQGIDEGYAWLCRAIMGRWDELNERVEREEREQVEIEKQIMQERFRRFRAQEDKAAEVDHHQKDERIPNGNPFRPIREVAIANGTAPGRPKRTTPSSSPAKVTVRPPKTAGPLSRSPKKSSSPSRPRATTAAARLQDSPGKRRTQNSPTKKTQTRSKGDQSSPGKERRGVVGSSSAKTTRTTAAASSANQPSPTKTAELIKGAKHHKKRRKSLFRSNKVTPLA